LSEDGTATTSMQSAAGATAGLVLDVAGYFAAPVSSGPPGQYYVPLATPARVLDTRPVPGDPSTPGDPLLAGTPRVLSTRDFSNVPPGATALALTASVVQPQGNGFLRLYPPYPGTQSTSVLNFRTGDLLTNGSIVGVSALLGNFTAWSTHQTHLILDVWGAFAPSGSRKYFRVPPCRVLYTEISGTFNFRLGGACGVPLDAVAVSANYTVVDAEAPGNLKILPAGQSAAVANLLFQPTWRIGSGGLLTLGNQGWVTATLTTFPANAKAKLAVDVTGFFY
jgi:hypothetical protein